MTRRGTPEWRRKIANAIARHGQTVSRDGHPSKLWQAWSSMKTRCMKTYSPSYPRYGGRGIRVCRRWLLSFEDFASDVGEPPSKQHSLGRINNDGNYCPSNCRWETVLEQAKNTARCRRIRIFGETKTAKQWAKDHRCAVKYSTFLYRLTSTKMKPVLALTKPPRQYKKAA